MNTEIAAFTGKCDENSVAARRSWAASHPLKRKELIEGTLKPISYCLAEAQEMRDDLMEQVAVVEAKIIDLRCDQ